VKGLNFQQISPSIVAGSLQYGDISYSCHLRSPEVLLVDGKASGFSHRWNRRISQKSLPSNNKHWLSIGDLDLVISKLSEGSHDLGDLIQHDNPVRYAWMANRKCWLQTGAAWEIWGPN
jgi:hypothetical protein